jgi:hypothetical protein
MSNVTPFTGPSGQTGGNSQKPPPIKPILASLPDPTIITPREWLMGRILKRGDTTVLVGIGAGGKTSLAITVALSVITGRPLLGMQVFQRCKVWYLTLEDDRTELDRRIAAAMLHHEISKADIEENLYLHYGRERPLILAELSERLQDGMTVIRFTDIAELEDAINAEDFGLLIIDPLIKSHKLTENSNTDMDAVITELNALAYRTGCAILLLHHTRKSSNGSVDDSRGAGSLVFGARIALMLRSMPAEEAADRFGVPRDDAWRHLRLDDGKVNMAPRGDARWFRLMTVELGNGAMDERYPAGDQVQAIEPWKPQPTSAWATLDHPTLTTLFSRFRAGPIPGELYSASNHPSTRYRAVRMMVSNSALTEPQAVGVLATWVDKKVLTETEYRSPVRNRHKARGLCVNEALVREILAGLPPASEPAEEFE